MALIVNEIKLYYSIAQYFSCANRENASYLLMRDQYPSFIRIIAKYYIWGFTFDFFAVILMICRQK